MKFVKNFRNIRKRGMNMGIYEELQARGLIAQVTDEEKIRELIKKYSV